MILYCMSILCTHTTHPACRGKTLLSISNLVGPLSFHTPAVELCVPTSLPYTPLVNVSCSFSDKQSTSSKVIAFSIVALI